MESTARSRIGSIYELRSPSRRLQARAMSPITVRFCKTGMAEAAVDDASRVHQNVDAYVRPNFRLESNILEWSLALVPKGLQTY